MPLRVTVWHEFRHEKKNATVAKIYPKGMHEAIAQHLRKSTDLVIKTATLDEPEHGLTDEVLKNTDVLTWWGHMAHGDVKDEIAAKVAKRVYEGMGLVVLHSGHLSKPFVKLMGTTGFLKWREAGEKERIWVVSPGHPITRGLSSDCIVIDHEEMYGEHFDIPDPDELIFISWFEGGEVFRSGCVWKRGAGKIFYFRPGHETFPSYHHPDVLKVIENGCRYVAPASEVVPFRASCPRIEPSLEPIKTVHVVDESIHRR
ncbi:MAG TPA: ThuA domain-containing protein [Tepidisphaeraceae bacterium]|nr:ThuA domain-containing protein [Tepidisphaeraceae bacterium]